MSQCICNDESIGVATVCVNVDCKATFKKMLTHHERMLQCTAHPEEDRFHPYGGMSHSSNLCDDCEAKGYYYKRNHAGILEPGLQKK